MANIVLDRIGNQSKTFVPGKFYKIKHFESPTSRNEITSQGMFIAIDTATVDKSILLATFTDSTTATGTNITCVYVPAKDVTHVWDSQDKFSVDRIVFKQNSAATDPFSLNCVKTEVV